jgi:excisionase family DNA binding protein
MNAVIELQKRDQDHEILLTPEEVCSWLKIPKSWLYGRIHAKNLPFAMRKIGRYVRFPESGIREFLERQGASDAH